MQKTVFNDLKNIFKVTKTIELELKPIDKNNEIMEDKEINEIYFYNTIIDGTDFTQNCLSSYDGEALTDLLIQNQTVDWSGKIDGKNYHQGDYQAACCCRRYHTVGTNAGDWYLPSIGELGYISLNYDDVIYPVIEQLITYNKTSFRYNTFNTIQSSTKYDNNNIGLLIAGGSQISSVRYNYNYDTETVAFLKV